MFEKLSFKKLSIRNKIIALIIMITLLFSLLLLYSPNAARNMGAEVLTNDIRFFTNIMADNVALGMQTRILDDGAMIAQSLALLKRQGLKDDQSILNVTVFDEKGDYVYSLYENTGKSVHRCDALQIEDSKNYIESWIPLNDADKNLLGYLNIEFSKHFINQRAYQYFYLSLIIVPLISILTVMVGIFITKRATQGIDIAVMLMKDIAQGDGDLTKRLPVESEDEIGRLNQWINAFMDKLHDLLKRVKVNTDQVNQGVIKITSASEELAAGAEEQSMQASEISSSVQEMTASIAQNAQNAGQTARISEEATVKAKQGSEAMQQTRTGMEEIVKTTERLREIIKTLTSRADQIEDIIRVIDKIADQTNLLALNAAVEAARAGEQGSGFAVVADEVRKLAERTTEATKQIAQTIEDIQADTRLAAESMNETNLSVQKGRDSSEKTEKMLDEIVLTVAQAMDMIQQIAAASEEQSAGAEEISSSMDVISNVTRQSAENTEVVANATRDLDTQVKFLREVVGQFKLLEES